jgi:beta-mannosidase
MRVDSPGVVHHQKAADGMAKLARGLAPRFGSVAPAEFDRWHYLTQLQQTRAIATGVEHWRTHWPRNTGVIVWQLNDLWPVSSWSAIDSAGRLKPLAHELRRLYDDVLLTIRPVSSVPAAGGAGSTGGSGPVGASGSVDGSGPVGASGSVGEPSGQPGGADRPTTSASASETADLGDLADTLSLGVSPGSFGNAPIEVAVRSTRTGHDSVVRVRRVNLSGTVLAEVSLPVRLSDAGVAVVALPESVGVVDDPTKELVVADMDWRRAVWTPAPDKDMRWEPARYRTEVVPAPDGDGLELVVQADSLVRDLLVQPDRVSPSGTVDRGFMTLLPGERVAFRLRGLGTDDAETVTAEPVILTLDRVLEY